MDDAIVRKSGEITMSNLAPDKIDLIQKLWEWENDESIRHLHLVTRSAEEFANYHVTLDDLQKRVSDVYQSKKDFFWMLFYATQPVGMVTGSIDPRHLYRKEPGTFWPSIMIGENLARGKGIGRQGMIWCEEMAVELGCKRIELGVFEFNHVAQKLYTSLGYQKIARIPDFTWWDGSLRADIRMEKYIEG